MKVLIAEDDNTTSEMLTNTIRKWGFEPVPVDDGEKALNVLRMVEAPRIALLDWMMPVMDGLEVLKTIRNDKNLKDIYVILLTSVGENEKVTEAINARANDYVIKPYESYDLHLRLMKAQRYIENIMD